MQLVRTLHSQATEKSFFVLSLNTWNKLSGGGGAPWTHSGEGIPKTQSHPCLLKAGCRNLPPASMWPNFIGTCSWLKPRSRGTPASLWEDDKVKDHRTPIQHATRQREGKGLGFGDGKHVTSPPAPRPVCGPLPTPKAITN